VVGCSTLFGWTSPDGGGALAGAGCSASVLASCSIALQLSWHYAYEPSAKRAMCLHIHAALTRRTCERRSRCTTTRNTLARL
jgi:hypothetical protein